MAVSPTVRINVSGARGPRGEASGPLGLNSVGGDEINPAEAPQIRDKIVPAKGAFSRSASYEQGEIGGKLSQLPSPLDDPYGAAGDGANDDSAATNAATADVAPGGDLLVPDGTRLRVTSWDNPLGARVRGGGHIVTGLGAAAYSNWTYARDRDFSFGRENDYALKNAINAAGTPWNAFVYGDSTVATSANGGIPGGSNTPDVLLAELMRSQGVRNLGTVTNRAVGGTKWGDANPLTDLGTSTKLAVFKYNINHVSGQDVAAELNAARSQVAAIRAAPNGAWHQLTIVIVSANSTHDTAGGRTNLWYEQLNSGLQQIAWDYGCVFVDVYGRFPDSRRWAGYYSDTPSVHPQDLLRGQMWAFVVDCLIPRGSLHLSTGDRRIAVSYANSWANRAGSGGYPGQVWLLPDGRGRMRGEASPPSNAVTINDAIVNLPNANYRPSLDTFAWAAAYDGTNWTPWPMGIDTAGKVFARKSGTGITAFRFDGMEWDTR